MKYSLSIPTEGHPNILRVIGDLVGAQTSEATEDKTRSKGGGTAWKKQHMSL